MGDMLLLLSGREYRDRCDCRPRRALLFLSLPSLRFHFPFRYPIMQCFRSSFLLSGSLARSFSSSLLSLQRLAYTVLTRPYSRTPPRLKLSSTSPSSRGTPRPIPWPSTHPRPPRLSTPTTPIPASDWARQSARRSSSRPRRRHSGAEARVRRSPRRHRHSRHRQRRAGVRRRQRLRRLLRRRRRRRERG